MASWIDGLRDRLVAAGIGKRLSDVTLADADVAVSVDFLPPSHSRVVALFGDSGRSPTQVHDIVGVATHRPRLRAWCRHDVRDRSSAEDLAASVLANLSQIRNTTIGGFWFHSVWPTGDPVEVTADEQERSLYLVIFDVERNAT